MPYFTKNRFINFRNDACVSGINGGAAATGADTTITNISIGGQTIYLYNEGTNDVRISPESSFSGIRLPSTNSDNVGGTMTFGGLLDGGGFSVDPYRGDTFYVGDEKPFYCRSRIFVPDISEYDVLSFGFVETPSSYVTTIQSNVAFLAAYDEKAMVGMYKVTGEVATSTSLAGVDVQTELATTALSNNWVLDMAVFVDAEGAVTYKVATYITPGAGDGDAIAADANAVPFSFAANTYLCPAFIFCKANTVDAAPFIQTIEWGYQ